MFSNLDARADPTDSSQAAARKAIGRGNTLFNTKVFVIMGAAASNGQCTVATCGEEPSWFGSNSG